MVLVMFQGMIRVADGAIVFQGMIHVADGNGHVSEYDACG